MYLISSRAAAHLSTTAVRDARRFDATLFTSNMNKKIDKKIVAGAIGAVLILSGAWIFFGSSSGGGGSTAPTATTTPQASTSPQQTTGYRAPAKSPAWHPVQKPPVAAKISGITPLAYLFSLKQSLLCAIQTTDSYKRSGTMYVADGKMRVNFARTSMIDDGMYFYAWTDGAAQGLRLLAASSASGSAIAGSGGFDPASNISFACNPWTANMSVFVPPASVSFSN